MKNKNMLVVDDQDVNRYLLKKNFEEEYDVYEAKSGKEVISILKSNKINFDIILLDIMMPEVDGFQVLDFMNSHGFTKKIPVVMITGDTSSEVEEKGFEYGVADFITKPFNQKIVYKRVENVVELFEHKNKLEYLVKKQMEKIDVQERKAKDTQGQIIDILSSVVEFRNLESGNHIKRIKNLTKILAQSVSENNREYNLSEKQIVMISTAAMLHDVGKIAIPDNILLKPGRLTEDEFEIMKTHTAKGAEIVERLKFIEEKEFFKYCYEISRHHHEKYDGKGYPDELKGDEIPLCAQIVSVADVYDALVSDRVYKKAFTPQKAYDMILGGECGMFNPKILECFKLVKEKFKKIQTSSIEQYS